jgi:Acetyltransferase (GNAT) domain
VTVYTETLPGLGELTLIRLDPAAHADLVHGWVIQPRNRFWGMGEHTVAQVREIYEFVDGLATHHAFLIRVDEQPIGIFQTYDPEHDPVGECYPVEPGDFGVHLMLAPGDLVLPHLSSLVVPALVRYAFRDPAHRRVIAEPDLRNEKAIRRLTRHGFTLGPEIDLGHKRARLAFLTRDQHPGRPA